MVLKFQLFRMFYKDFVHRFKFDTYIVNIDPII